MMTQLFLVLVTAAVTSATTLGAAWYLYERHLRERLEAAIAAKTEELEEKADQLAERMRERVRDGVREGIREGLSELRSDLVSKATEGAAKSGMSMLEDSMSMWLGKPRRRRDK